MKELLEAAMAAFPGAKWRPIDHGYQSDGVNASLRIIAGATKKPYEVSFEGRWQRKGNLQEATKWLRMQVTIRRDALAVLLGEPSATVCGEETK